VWWLILIGGEWIGDGESPAGRWGSFCSGRLWGLVVVFLSPHVKRTKKITEGGALMSSGSFNIMQFERSAEFGRQVREVPAVVSGQRVVALPDDTTIDGWAQTRWGVRPVLSRAPLPSEAHWPGWPLFSERSLDAATALLDSYRGRRQGQPLGYLGSHEQALERRYAGMIGPDDKGREPLVFVLDTGTHSLDVVYLAIMSRLRHEGRPIPATPNVVVPARSFEATWTSLQRAGIKPVFVDVDRGTGCLTLEALEAASDENTVAWAYAGLYDRSPAEIDAIQEAAHQRGILVAGDWAHAHMATWLGVHVANFCDIMIVSGQGSKIVTPGSELGIVVTYDPVLAAFVAKIRNVGRGLAPAPDWWPADLPDAAGENARGAGELHAILMAGSFDLYGDLLESRRATLTVLAAGLAHFNGPWRLMAPQDRLGGMMYKAQLVWDPDASDKPGAWERIGWDASRRLLAEELLTEVAAGYPPPWEPESEYNPDSRPWIWGSLTPDINPADYPNAAWLSRHVHCLPHEALARTHGGTQVLTAVHKLHRWADHVNIQRWAMDYNRRTAA
jgi:L-glutamine:2-deoxy-scyllo-inosose/3-amino-2,3-dideoxy-scyllo-inosose aminotransferase